MSQFNVHSIIEGCLNNNRQAQQQLYQHYADLMLGLCIRYIKDKPQAEEIMIGGFMKVFDKIGSFRQEGSFEGWIKRLMVNECLMHLRKEKKHKNDLEIEKAYHEITPSQPDTGLEAGELLKLIKSLPEGYRTVFNMYAIEGYSHKEIAKTLGINEGTSKSQLSKARKHLKELIKKYEHLS